jgi:integrase
MACIKRRTWIVRGKVRQGFQAQVRQKGHPALSKLFATRSDALNWSKEIEAKLLLGAEVKKEDGASVADLLKRYLAEVTPQKRGKEPERYRLAKLCRDPIAHYSIAKLSPVEVADYRDRRLASAAPDTVIKELNLLSAVFETARKEWRYPYANPVRDIRKPRPNGPREVRLSESQIDEILAKA